MSNGLPPPPDLLGIAMQAQQVRRQAEQDRLNTILMTEKMRESAFNTAQDFMAKGMSAKDALVMAGYNDPLVEARVKTLEKQLKANKEAELQAETQKAAISPLQAIMPELARGINDVNTEQYGRAVSALASTGVDPEALTPLLAQFSTMVQAGPFERLAEERKRQETLSLEQEKADIARRKELAVKAGSLKLEDESFLRKQANAAKYDALGQTLASAYRGDPGAIAPTLQTIQSQLENPALEMPIVVGNANKLYAASNDASTIQEEFARQGYRVPLPLAKKVADGSADIDEFTGLVSIDAGPKGDDMRQARAQSMYALIELKEVARKVVTGPLAGKNLAERKAWVAEQYAKYEAGAESADPLYAEFRNRTDQLTATLTRSTFTGVASNQERQFIRGMVVSTNMLAGNSAGTDVSPAIEAAFNSLFSSTEGRYRAAIPRSVFDDKTLRRVLKERKEEHAAGFRSDYLDTTYPAQPSAGGWTRGN